MEQKIKFYRDYRLGNIRRDFLLRDGELAYKLAEYNVNFGKHKLAQDPEVLALKYGMVAWSLARNSDKNRWGETPAAQNIEVLKLVNGMVAWNLAFRSRHNGWSRGDAAQNLDILRLIGGDVAYWLARHSDKNRWGNTPVVGKEEVLGLCNGKVGEMINELKNMNIRLKSMYV